MTQSNEPAIDIMNEAIASFEGRKFNGYPIEKFGTNTYNALPEMKYHTSWDWLMPVIDEIFKYALAYPDRVKPVIEMKVVVNISAAHEKVYQFCKWLNQQKQKDGEG